MRRGVDLATLPDGRVGNGEIAVAYPTFAHVRFSAFEARKPALVVSFSHIYAPLLVVPYDLFAL